MANRTIVSQFFKIGFPHLAEPHAAKQGDTPKFGIQMMFPKTGITTVTGQATSSWENIFTALDEVCMEAWKISFAQATAPGMGIQFPPSLQDGDTKFVKDANGNPQPGQVRPETAGMYILSAKNLDPVGTAGADGADIDPKAIYAGCWCRAQLEVSAYDGKQGRVVALKVVNVQMCYDDTPIGNKQPAQTATQAFGNMAVTDTNIAAGTGQTLGAVPAPAAPTAPAAPAVTMLNGLNYAEMIAAGWTNETLIAHGHAEPNFLNPAG